MYIPNYFNATDKESAFNFMQKYNFATLVSISNNLPIATHLPFIINQMLIFHPNFMIKKKVYPHGII